MKVIDLFNESKKLLKDTGISTEALDAKVLLSFLLKIETSDFFLHLDDIIFDDFKDDYLNLLSRRIKREPIANIINKKYFWDEEFFVNQDVLTPRNDSEILIEAVLKNFQNKTQSLNILDLGTGSGCLILTLLKLFPFATGTAVDISEKALEVAKINAKKLNIKNIKFIKNNWNDNLTEKFDVIISNPPYIIHNDINCLDLEVKDFNPKIALDGGVDGLSCYRYLSENITKNIKKSSMIFLEIGKDQEKDIEKIFLKNNFVIKNIYKDFNGIYRILTFVKELKDKQLQRLTFIF